MLKKTDKSSYSNINSDLSRQSCHNLFDDAPVAMWVQDMSLVKARLDKLRNSGIRSFKDYFEEHPGAVTALMALVTVTNVNKAALELFKTDAPQFLRFGLALIYGDQNATAFAAELAAVAEGVDICETEISLFAMTGEVRKVAVRRVLQRAGADAYSSVPVVAFDLTRRASSEKTREQAEFKKRHAEKVDSLAEMAGKISHDFNNVIMIITGYTKILRKKLGKQSDADEMLGHIEDAANRAVYLSLQLQTSSGNRMPEKALINVNHFIGNIKTVIPELRQVNSILKLDLAMEPLSIMADSTQLRQVIHTLVTNAADAIGEKPGIVTLRAGSSQYASSEEINLHDSSPGIPPGNYVFIEVTDTGCGMDKETLAKLFTPYFTTKERAAALSMSVVLGIVKSHDGGIEVTSEPGQGTSVKLLFPSASDDAALAASASETPLETGGLILVIDDEPMIREVLGFMLGNLGYSVISAADGQAGVELYKQRHDEITAVLLDLVMPGMHSEEAFREIRRINPDAVVYLSTGASSEMARQQFNTDDIAGIIHKPYREDKLARVLKSNSEKQQAEGG